MFVLESAYSITQKSNHIWLFTQVGSRICMANVLFCGCVVLLCEYYRVCISLCSSRGCVCVRVRVCVCVCVCTNGEADSFEIVQAVQSLLGLGQVLGKLGMQQPHGERHHGAC